MSGACGNPGIKTLVVSKFQTKLTASLKTIDISFTKQLTFSIAFHFVCKIYSSTMDSSTYTECQFNLILLGTMKFPSHLFHWKLLQILLPKRFLPGNCGLVYANLGSC